jgi:hypothetical protein
MQPRVLLLDQLVGLKVSITDIPPFFYLRFICNLEYLIGNISVRSMLRVRSKTS